MNKLELLLIDILDVRSRKIKSINDMKYENAAHFRDEEIRIQRLIYNIISKDGSEYSHTKYDNLIDGYCIKNYGFDYEFTNPIQAKRQIKLKSIGL